MKKTGTGYFLTPGNLTLFLFFSQIPLSNPPFYPNMISLPMESLQLVNLSQLSTAT